jgi:Ser/Thr protein kinase RdoA (MazF antagonist)
MLMFEEAPPPLPGILNEALFLQMGESIASLHAAADELDTDFGIPNNQIDAWVGEHVYYTSRFLSQSDRVFLEDISQQLTSFLDRLPCDKPDFGLCHADLVLSNLRLTLDGKITIFDFGSTLKTWRVFELAVFYWSLRNRYQDCQEYWDAFLQGYQSKRILPEALSGKLAVMLVLRQVSFLGGNCATLPLRLGTEPFESNFIENGMAQLRNFVEEAGIGNL